MAKRDNNTADISQGKDTTWMAINTDVIEWIDVIAECYDLTTREVTEMFLRYGAKNHEAILGWEY